MVSTVSQKFNPTRTPTVITLFLMRYVLTSTTPLPPQGDLYFTSSILLPNSKTDSWVVLPDTKLPKNIDKKAFSASANFTPPGVSYVYKITADGLLGRRDSVSSILSSQSYDEQSSILEVPESVDTCLTGSYTNSDVVQPILPEESSDVSSPCGNSRFFVLNSSPSDSTISSEKKMGTKAIFFNDSDGFSGLSPSISGGGAGQLSVLDLETSVCSSPDSGVVRDDFSNALPIPSTFKPRTEGFSSETPLPSSSS